MPIFSSLHLYKFLGEFLSLLKQFFNYKVPKSVPFSRIGIKVKSGSRLVLIQIVLPLC